MGIKVYYIDDEPDLCEIFEDLFATKDIVIETFTDPLKLLETTLLSPPDIIFMDYRMPVMNGVELAKKMPIDLKKYLISGESSLSPDYPFHGILYKPFDIVFIKDLLSKTVGGL